MTSSTDQDEPAGFWAQFRADVRRDYASAWREFLDGGREVREQWRELTAMIRQDRQLTRLMKQRITGVENPTRRQWRAACKALDAKAREKAAVTAAPITEGEQE